MVETLGLIKPAASDLLGAASSMLKLAGMISSLLVLCGKVITFAGVESFGLINIYQTPLRYRKVVVKSGLILLK